MSYLVNVLLMFLVIHSTTSQSLADPKINTTVQLSFIVKKNQTGHFITKWLLRTDSYQLPDTILIDIKSGVSEHEGIQTYILQGDLTVPPSRPSGYEYFPGIGFYKFYAEGVMNFSLASSICITDGAHLAIINSEAEEDALLHLYKKNPTAKEYGYLGFHDIDEEGKYVTVLGDPLETTNFSKWAAGEPSPAEANEDCGSLYRGGGLNDLHCAGGNWPFFCEYELSWATL